MSNVDTREREIRPYLKLNVQVQKLLVINRPIGEIINENEFLII